MKKIVIIGNPNVGKTTFFNQLTGLKQKTGNYPGITVEKKSANIQFENQDYKITDLPGIYSVYPSSRDEELVTKILVNPEHEEFPDLAILVVDFVGLKRGIILYQQIRSLDIPALLVINTQKNKEYEFLTPKKKELEEILQTKVFLVNVKSSQAIAKIQQNFDWTPEKTFQKTFEIPLEYQELLNSDSTQKNTYRSWFSLVNADLLGKAKLSQRLKENKILPKRLKIKETVRRNQWYDQHLKGLLENANLNESNSDKIDKILTHPISGYMIFFALILLMFQAIYSWAEKPMDFIEGGIVYLGETLSRFLPEGPINEVLTQGIIPGLAGIFVFIPQIAILFFFISLMEASGYMSRVVYLMDRWMKPFGLNGKSVVPLISGVACAIPAIMSARNIENHKERMITILVTPFMTCSARLPIYTILIALIIPETNFLGFNLQGITLFGLYFLGVFGALFSAWVLKKILKTNYKSFLILELPDYKLPFWKDVLSNVLQKTWSFIWGAGRVILAISIILWVLGSFGVGATFNNAEQNVLNHYATNGLSDWEKSQITGQMVSKRVEAIQNNKVWNALNSEIELKDQLIQNAIQSEKLEHSFLGYLGKTIEPIVEPLGYDWKIGIGLISSFAAREVFVGTMGTIYSLGETENEESIENKMRNERNPETGKPIYTFATGISLLLFYAFAMQCMSTLAVVKQETNSWKWTVIQTSFMTVLAYLSAFVAFQILS